MNMKDRKLIRKTIMVLDESADSLGILRDELEDRAINVDEHFPVLGERLGEQASELDDAIMTLGEVMDILESLRCE